MKKIQLSLITLFACTNFAMAGGDILEVTPYEIEDIQTAEIFTPVEEVIVQEPIRVQPPVKVQPPIVVQTPIPVQPVVVATPTVSPIYVGIGLAAARYESNCNCGTKSGVDKTAGIAGRVGYDFNKYMGIEARAMYTPIKENGGKIKHIGAFVKPMYPVSKDLTVYGLVGLAKTTTEGELQHTDVNGLAFGAGVEYDLSADKKKDAKYDRKFDGIADQEKGFGVFADYERLYYKSGSPDLDAVSVGLTYDF